MKFVFEYRTSDNVRHAGTVTAATRDAAFAILKGKGIRPSRLAEAPGFFNLLWGRGKRWMAIVLLGGVTLALAVANVRSESPSVRDWDDRAQLYGDPAVVATAGRNGWESTFPDLGERFLALHAIPGAECGCATRNWNREEVAGALAATVERPVSVAEDELAEVVKIKRMVNGMKRELAAYLRDGGNVNGYMERLDIRQKAEAAIVDRARSDLSRTDDLATWKSTNARLRAMGLPMICPEEE